MATAKKTTTATVKYSATTGKKLKAGEKTTDAKGNTYTQGQSISTSSGGGSSSSNSGSSSSSVNVINFNPNTGAKLQPGESVINAATGQKVTQGQPLSSSSSSSSSGGDVINYNPNDGSKLSPGQSVFDNNTGKYVTQGTPLGTVSSTPPKPAGINAVSSILNFGSQGEQVKELQNYLAGIGYKNADGTPLKADGIFGNATKTAVMQFQSKNGLTPDGIVGPLTIANLKKVTTTEAQADQNAPISPTIPINTGDPILDDTLRELQTFIKAQQDAGLKINEALNFDQNTLDKFLETAKKQVHPFYQQQIDAIKADVLRTAPQILQNYGNDVEKARAEFESGLGKAREGYADSGLAFSGQRGAGERGMEAEQNRNLQTLNQGYGNKLYDLGRTAEQKIGADNTPSLGSLANYSANLSGNGGFTLVGSSTPYTSGGYNTGSLQRDEAADIEARNQALKKTASESVVAGRDYSSLFA